MYEVYIGCEEWQESQTFETLKEAKEYISSWKDNFIMGLYPASAGWIEDILTKEKEIFIDYPEYDEGE